MLSDFVLVFLGVTSQFLSSAANHKMAQGYSEAVCQDEVLWYGEEKLEE